MLAPNILQIRDETASGVVVFEMQLQFDTEQVTIKEIIEKRVTKEVAKYQQGDSQSKYDLITPRLKERFLNKKLIKKKKIDVNKQIEIALKAFENSGYFMLVDDYQVERLDDVVQINNKTVISFIKLTQLVGG